MNTPRLSMMAYIILGLLTEEELSGYDVQLVFRKELRHFFTSPAKSQIYSELRHLEACGLATSQEIPQTQRPDKRLYRITPQGQKVVRDWLAATAPEPEMYRSPLLLRLFFGDLVDPEVLIAHLVAHRRTLVKELGQYEAYATELQEQVHKSSTDTSQLFPLLVLQCTIAQHRAALDWVAESIEKLQQRTRVGASHSTV